MTPPIVYVMGASGTGKDSVLQALRAYLRPQDRTVIAHRYITRPADAGGENHVALTSSEFALRLSAGLFAYDWSAHGLQYGIGLEIRAWQSAGLLVVVSGSRAHFATLGANSGLLPVVITARPDIVARRLATRGREDPLDISRRLARADGFGVDHPALVTIDNSGLLESTVAAFLGLLRHVPVSTTRQTLTAWNQVPPARETRSST